MPRLHACSLLALSLPVQPRRYVEDGHAHPGCIQFPRREPCQQPEGKGSQRHSASVGQSRKRHKEIGLPFRETGNEAHRNACYPSGRRDQRALTCRPSRCCVRIVQPSAWLPERSCIALGRAPLAIPPYRSMAYALSPPDPHPNNGWGWTLWVLTSC